MDEVAGKRKLGAVEVTVECRRYVGGRYIHGGVTLSFFGAVQPYSFVSRVTWPHDNYEKAVREVVEEVLIEQLGSLEKGEVILKSITWDDIASCESGFRHAARVATRGAFID